MIPELNLSELQQRGYREDDESRRVFEQRYRWPAILGVIVALSGPCWLTIPQSVPGLLSFLGGIAVLLGTAWHAARATPSNKINGHPMQRFRRSDAGGKRTEYIYVDDESRTYFVRLISQSTW